MVSSDDMNDTADQTAEAGPAETGERPEADLTPEAQLKLVQRITQTIRGDAKHHSKAFERMRRDQYVAMHGAEATYPKDHYKAAIAGRHVKQKTAALYAKNPKATARRAERIDFSVWDENPESLMSAMALIQQAAVQAEQAAMTAPPTVDPMTGEMVPAAPAMPPGFEQAQAIVADFQQGMMRRQQIDRVGKTLEILFAHYLREQKPVDFKTGAKQLVRRTCTNGVGYIEIGFQREYGPRPGMTEKLADYRSRLDHLTRLAKELDEGEIEETAAEAAELEASITSLTQEPEVLVREGLIFDFPRSTKVIPDKLCKTLVGFIGARHLTLEYDYTRDEVEEMFGVDLGSNYIGYSADGKPTAPEGQGELFVDDGVTPTEQHGNGLVRVWKHYDKVSGLVYYLADGYKAFLREPAAPDVFVEDFWPVYALTFNEVESEAELFPLSDVALLLDMQNEYNRSRQGMREHRKAARPRWAYPNGIFDDEDVARLKSMEPFEAIGMNIDPQTKVGEFLQPIPVPGVDPNLYETNQLFTDMQLVAGTQEAQLGGVSKSTATESAIAANSSATSDGSSVDDLDGFLTVIARSSGQILLREMSEEKVKEIAGPGALWPDLPLADIAGEIYLEVEAGSTGKPNRAVELQNWEKMLPYMIQMPGIQPVWLARETIRRLDDRLDLTEAIAAGIPSIMMQNRMSQMTPGNPAEGPEAQGDKGGDKAPAPRGDGGSDPAFGSNQM